MGERKLGEIAKYLRSKNAGPFKLTLDVFFHSKADYERVKSSGIITNERIADLYGLPDTQRISVYEFDRVAAIKVTFPRSIPSGSFGDKDIYGAQQHLPLHDTLIPWHDESGTGSENED